MAATRRKLPSIFRHASGQYAFKLKGRMVYAGRDLEHARKLVAQAVIEGPEAGKPPAKEPVLLSELLAAFLEHAESYHAADGKEVAHCRLLARLMAESFPLVNAADFGPKRLEAIRTIGVEEKGWSRKFANAQMNRARRFFRWAVGQELVPASVLEGLKALAPLRAGKCTARENPPRGPVSEADFEATLAELGDVPRDLCRLLMATGMRPNEACKMRVGDLDMTESPWRYTMRSHKTVEHVGARVVFLGEQAQGSIRPHLKPDAGAFVFRTPEGGYYAPTVLSLAIKRACVRAGVGHWTAYQIRHAAADRIQRALGTETAKILLGHTTMKMPENYLTPDMVKAKEAAMRLG